MILIPTRVFFTKGAGVHREKLQSFEAALRKAGIAKVNLVRVSSIFPPDCRIVPAKKGLDELKAGQIVYVVMSENQTNEPNRMLAASVALAAPADRSRYGYLSEHHSFGEPAQKVSDYCEDLAATMLATTLGIDFDPDTAYDERKEIYRMSGQIVHTRHTTQTARADKNGRWTTVIAAAVFLP